MLFQIIQAIKEILGLIILDHPFYGLLTILVVLLMIKILSPLFRMWQLKLKHGKDIYYKYFPIIGIMQVMRKSYKTKGNVHIWVAEIIEKQPEVKMIVSNTTRGLVYVVVDPDYYKPLYLDHHLVSKSDVSGVKDFLLNGGLLFSEGQRWKEQRQILGDHFLFPKLKARIPMMNEVIKEKMSTQKIEKVFEFICGITGGVVIRSFFGEETKNWQINGRDAQIEIGDVFSTFVSLRISNLLVYFKQMFLGKKSWDYCIKSEKLLKQRVTKVKEDITNIINQRINKIKSGSYIQNEDRDFLDVQLDFFLNQNQQQKEYTITIDDIVAQFATLFLGGTDTTAALIANTLFLLSENTQYIQDLRDEVQSVLKDGDVTSDNLNKLVLIEGALKETLRIKPSVVYPVPRVANSDFYIQNILIRKGDAFLIANSFANTKQRYYDQPFQYNPKRWLQEQPIKEDNGFINIPFAAGGRNCIGQHMAMIEARILLAYIIRNYNVERNQNVKKSQWPSRGVSTFLPSDAVHLIKI